jgi:DNA-binding response OmpR family regulator
VRKGAWCAGKEVRMARILVVDGDERYRLVCSETLERQGHEVWTAATGVEALRVTDEHLPDMVITEIQLPGMDGLDLMARLLERHRGILVILNSKSSYYKDNFMSWAADACLTKSVDSRELSAKIRELLNRQGADMTQASGSRGKSPIKPANKDLGPHVRERELVHQQ